MKPWPLAIAVAALLGAGIWTLQTPQIASGSPAPAAEAADARLDQALVEMGVGLTYLRQAAKTGDPEGLRQAEQDVLLPLLDALELSLVGTPPRVEPGRYRRVLLAVSQAEGLFKYVPYFIEVQPGAALPAMTLPLRRSPWPLLERREMRWEAALVEGGVRLRPRPQAR